MAVSTWVYDKTTGRFLYGGYYTPTFDGATQAIATFLDRHPDPAREKWDPVNSVVVPVTPAEVTADTAAAVSAQADKDAGQRAIAASVYYTLRVTLGRNPTAPEFAAGLTTWKTIYRGLP